MKKIIVALVFILIFASLFFMSYLSSHTTMNDENALGNTPANLLNGGLFCENDGKIYFSNPMDRGTLYVMDSDMSNVKKLNDDTCFYINTTNKYIIYSRNNYEREAVSGQFFNFQPIGLFRTNKKDGSGIKTLFSGRLNSVSLLGNYIYYQRDIDKAGLQLYTVKIDGTEESIVLEEAIFPGAYSDGKLIYHGVRNDHNIYSMNLSNFSHSILYDGNCYNVVTTNKYIYFLSLSNNYAIARINLDGTDPVLLVKERCSFFNLSPDEKYLYYQVDGGDNNRLCRMNLSTLESETIKDGDYNSIHVTEHYVFFRDFSTKQFYYITTATGVISSFSPSVEK